MLTVHYFSDPQKDALGVLRSLLETTIQLTVGEEIPSHPDYQVLVNGTPERDQLEASPHLHSLIIPYTGVPVNTRTLLLEFPHFKVYNLHYNAAPTAEMAIALLLTAAKFLIPIDRAFRNHDWIPRYQPNPSPTLEGKTALILGFGHIGQRVGHICQALGMEVIAIRRQPSAPLLHPVKAEIHPPQNLEDLLPRANILIITLPFTPHTDGLIDAHQLSLMKPSGILVNVGRGRIVEQEALFNALKHGTLAAAGLDVWYNYPQDPNQRVNTPPADYPFHELDNVVMSPHRGGGSWESQLLRMHHLAEVLNALSKNEPVVNQVDIQAGY